MIKLPNKVQKGLNYRPSVRVVAMLSLAALALLLVPLVRIAFYSVPWYDDYNYGSFAIAGMETVGGWWGAFLGALHCVKTQWYAWQGTYSSIFFMTLMPGIWGEQYYVLGPLFLIFMTVVSPFVLVKVLVRDLLGCSREFTCIMQSVTTALIVVLIHSSQEGFYWYNGGLHYVGMHGFGMLFVAACVKIILSDKAQSIGWMLVSVVLAMIVAGSNFVTSLQCGLILVLLVGLAFFFYRKRAVLLLPVLAVYAIGFYYNVAAPGNTVRAGSYVGWGYSAVESVLRSFLEGGRHAGEFTGLITVAVMVLLVPIIWNMLEGCKIPFRYPLLVALFSVCLYATGFTPSLYSLGHAGLDRTLNSVKITWQLLLLVNEVYAIGWWKQYCERKEKVQKGSMPRWWFYPLLGVCMLAIFAAEPNQAGTYSSYGAYYYVHTGEAYNFYQQYLERLEVLRGEETDIVFEPYVYRPWLICMGDLSPYADDVSNQALAAWYDKDSVAVEQKED